jgi:glutathione peroxidase
VSIYDVPIDSLEGESGQLAAQRGNVTLVVNVASQCGLTPQYTSLQRLQERYRDRGFSVLGFPCNQFLGQEPGSPTEIAEFCESNYGVTFPLFEKIDVNGDDRHPLYVALTEHADPEGHTGDIRWNFEKFLVDDDGTVIARFAPQVEPESDEIVTAIEKALDDNASRG